MNSGDLVARDAASTLNRPECDCTGYPFYGKGINRFTTLIYQILSLSPIKSYSAC